MIGGGRGRGKAGVPFFRTLGFPSFFISRLPGGNIVWMGIYGLVWAFESYASPVPTRGRELKEFFVSVVVVSRFHLESDLAY